MVTLTGGTIVIDATPDFVGSPADVAVTVINAGLGTAAGAVYRPLLEIVPHAAPLQLPLRLQVTAVFVAFFTVAVNCCLPPVTICALVGDTVTETGGTIVMLAELDFVGSATDVAVRETSAGLGTVFGAV